MPTKKAKWSGFAFADDAKSELELESLLFDFGGNLRGHCEANGLGVYGNFDEQFNIDFKLRVGQGSAIDCSGAFKDNLLNCSYNVPGSEVKYRFELSYFSKNWVGSWSYQNTKEKNPLSYNLNVSKEGVFGLGEDEFGKFVIRGILSHSMIKFVKLNIGGHKQIFIGNTNNRGTSVAVKGYWYSPDTDDADKKQGTFDLKGVVYDHQNEPEKQNDTEIDQAVTVSLNADLMADLPFELHLEGDDAVEEHKRLVERNNEHVKNDTGIGFGLNLGASAD